MPCLDTSAIPTPSVKSTFLAYMSAPSAGKHGARLSG